MSGPGPTGKTVLNRDSYNGTTPTTTLPAPPKQINATDAKVGSPSPASGKRGAGINLDSFYE